MKDKQNNDYFFLYVVFYMITKINLIPLYFGKLVADILSIILPKCLQTETLKDAKFRHDLVSNEHGWGINITFAISAMTGLLMLLPMPIIFWICSHFERDAIWTIFYIILTLGDWYIADHICDYLFIESKYRRRFREFSKKSLIWKLCWGFISVLFIAWSLYGSFYLIHVILT